MLVISLRPLAEHVQEEQPPLTDVDPVIEHLLARGPEAVRRWMRCNSFHTGPFWRQCQVRWAKFVGPNSLARSGIELGHTWQRSCARAIRIFTDPLLGRVRLITDVVCPRGPTDRALCSTGEWAGPRRAP